MTMPAEDRPPKRRKLDASLSEEGLASNEHHAQDAVHKSLERPISPPLSKRKSPGPNSVIVPTWGFDDVPKATPTQASRLPEAEQDIPRERASKQEESTKYVSSPCQLTHIEDMAPHQNVDVVQLRDILGNPMIKECWNFNFLFDVDFVMRHFDEDVRDLVKVKLIHGFWKNDDERRIAMLEQAERYPNVELLHAYIPDPFGTHHSKMLILFTHDDQAQVVIHTANMIARDWGNMTQAVWSSPLLPLLTSSATPDTSNSVHPLGSGERFKVDLLRYLKAYGKRLDGVTKQLCDYDFSAIKAAFIGSTPSRQRPTAVKSSEQTSFGWLGLQEILFKVPIAARLNAAMSPPHIVIQVSSIATLGAAPTWLTQFQSALSSSAVPPVANATLAPKSESSSFFSKSQPSSVKKDRSLRPKFNIIFPTPNEIRTSLDGYVSGCSIHMKLQSAQQQKQLEYLHPIFCHWKASSPLPDTTTKDHRCGQALRGPAAPHIKTYIRFSDESHETIDWAMVTSANLSKQAWGDVVNKKDEIWIQSWEAGIVVWPELFAESGSETVTVMVPVFGKDKPNEKDVPKREENMSGDGGGHAMQELVKNGKRAMTVVGFRMPYDLPLTSYGPDAKPWCATMKYPEPDWKGLTWGGY